MDPGPAHTGLAASACSAPPKVELPQDQLATLTGRVQEAAPRWSAAEKRVGLGAARGPG